MQVKYINSFFINYFLLPDQLKLLVDDKIGEVHVASYSKQTRNR
jgi:hypothetical protein